MGIEPKTPGWLVQDGVEEVLGAPPVSGPTERAKRKKLMRQGQKNLLIQLGSLLHVGDQRSAHKPETTTSPSGDLIPTTKGIWSPTRSVKPRRKRRVNGVNAGINTHTDGRDQALTLESTPGLGCLRKPSFRDRCVECLIGNQKKPIFFKVTEPSSIPYRTHSACAKRAAYPDPPRCALGV